MCKSDRIMFIKAGFDLSLIIATIVFFIKANLELFFLCALILIIRSGVLKGGFSIKIIKE